MTLESYLEHIGNLLLFLCQERIRVGGHSAELVELTDLAVAAKNMLDPDGIVLSYQPIMMAQYNKDREAAKVYRDREGGDLADAILYIRRSRKQREKMGIKDA